MPSTSTSHSDLPVNELRGRYYNGRSSRAHDVVVRFGADRCTITGSEIDRTYRVSELNVAERFEGTSRIISFPDGASCELPDSALLTALLKRSGKKESLANTAHRRWKWVALSCVLLVVVFGVTYRWGFPWIAEKLAYRLPDVVLTAVSNKTMETLDNLEMRGVKVAEPSALPEERQKELRGRFARLASPPGEQVTAKVHFRASKAFGPNAFALPDGTIVFFDDLIKLAQNDNEIIAVYCHEAGHAARRHGMRQIIQGSLTGLVLAAYLGDVSSLAGALSGWVLEAKYSRDFERDADRYAAAMLRLNGIEPRVLGTFLLRIEQKQGKAPSGEGRKTGIGDYLSSHPATEERLREMETLSMPSEKGK